MAFDCSVLAHLVKCMPPVVREGPYLARPAALLDRLRPFRADEDVRAVDLVYRAIARAVMRDLLLGTADAQGEVLSRHPRHCAHAGDLEKIGDMLGVVDLVEERLFVGIDIHGHHKEVLGVDRHEHLPRLSCACIAPGTEDRAIVGDVLLRCYRLEGPPCRSRQHPPHPRRPTIFPSVRTGSIGAKSRSSRPICPSSIPTTICGTGPAGAICSRNCWRIRAAATTSSPPCSCRRGR